ncbi:MAG: hypothetical protein NZ898_11445 [Myxococcota bacterium]|nr:hypothetical protein [Myxococcota bacterium]MDW8361944.1 hypothetical protein [Myxococcales bacterium]
MHRRLEVIDDEAHRGLGLPTIMSPALAARHGAPYVHAAVVAIDIDRIVATADEHDPTWPEDWDVLLMAEAFDAILRPGSDPAHLELVEDWIADLLERLDEGEPAPLGLHAAVAISLLWLEKRWPARLRASLDVWAQLAETARDNVLRLRKAHPRIAARLASQCLAVRLDPPLAPITRDWLANLATRDDTGP